MNKTDLALQDYSEALRIDPDDHRARVLLCAALAVEMRLDAAKRDCRIELDADDRAQTLRILEAARSRMQEAGRKAPPG